MESITLTLASEEGCSTKISEKYPTYIRFDRQASSEDGKCQVDLKPSPTQGGGDDKIDMKDIINAPLNFDKTDMWPNFFSISVSNRFGESSPFFI